MSALPSAARIDDLLPQTQCTRCGYPDCRAYAVAVAEGGADINRCPPGGATTLAALAALTGRPPRAIAPECGVVERLTVARIDETRCIGCTLCIQACPVDAILGAAKRMHTVLPSLCSGCDLCVAPCPVDCIEMVSAGRAWTPGDAAAARSRHAARAERLARAEPVARRRRAPVAALTTAAQRDAAVNVALARARARRQRNGGDGAQ